MTVSEAAVLKRLRALCLALPEAIETTTFDHPTFQAGPKRTFAVLDDHERGGALCIVFKADLAVQASLVRAAPFFLCKFGAKHGWTSLAVGDSIDWDQVRELISASYRLVALKRMVSALDSGSAPAARPARGGSPPRSHGPSRPRTRKRRSRGDRPPPVRAR